MSLKIIKAGLQDTVQDTGRYGHQYTGINPAGAMDRFSMQIANILVANDPGMPVIEMHFPASTILFSSDALIALSGANFSPEINGQPVPLYKPLIVAKNSVLRFTQCIQGARCYLAIKDGLQVPVWLNSSSANIKTGIKGLLGRSLRSNDEISFSKENNFAAILDTNDFKVLPWMAGTEWEPNNDNTIFVLPGREWNRLTESSKKDFLNNPFRITALSDRMGYQLEGESLFTDLQEELISSAVSYGTVQLLPGGQLIILMADHQTTGGYPRVGHVITAHHAKLAQMRAGADIRFHLTDIKTAELLLLKQYQHVKQLQYACTIQLDKFLKGKV